MLPSPKAIFSVDYSDSGLAADHYVMARIERYDAEARLVHAWDPEPFVYNEVLLTDPMLPDPTVIFNLRHHPLAV